MSCKHYNPSVKTETKVISQQAPQKNG